MGFFEGILCGGNKPNANWCGQKGAICALALVSLVGLLATMAFGYVTLIHNPEGIVKQICQDVHHLMGDLGNSGIPAFILFPAGIALVGASVSMKCAGSNIMSKGYCIRFFLLAAGLAVTVLTPVIFNSVDGDIMTHVWMYVIPATAGVLGLPAFWPSPKVTVKFQYTNGWEMVYINNNQEVVYYRDPKGKLYTELPDHIHAALADEMADNRREELLGAYAAEQKFNTKTTWAQWQELADGAERDAQTEEESRSDTPTQPEAPAASPAEKRPQAGGGGDVVASRSIRRRLASPMRRLVETINAAA